MGYQCKHCGEQFTAPKHNCPKRGLLNVDEDNSFLVSAVIGAMTDSTLLGGVLGGSIVGGLLGDALDGEIMDDIF